ncbi:MAG: CvpA family protein [Sedimentisphaerales bacterium]
MGSLLVVLIILGCVAYQYLKGTFVKSFAMVIISICASVVAFGYFELLANIFVSYGILVSWAQPLSFVLLFILAFAVLQTVNDQLTRPPIDLGFLPERIGRVICGIFLGLIVSGILLIAVAMAPIPANYPYQRFDERSPDPEKPSKVLLNADGFAAGWFSIISSGSFSGKSSFTTSHPAFLNQLYLNRLTTPPKHTDLPQTKSKENIVEAPAKDTVENNTPESNPLE